MPAPDYRIGVQGSQYRPGTYQPVDLAQLTPAQQRDLANNRTIDDETLYNAYVTSQNPTKPGAGLGYDGWVAVRAEMERRFGPQAVSQLEVMPSGTRAKTFGEVAGTILKKAAPIAAAFIPGIGPIAAGAIGAAGHAAGSALEKGSLSAIKPLQSLGAGVASGAGKFVAGKIGSALGGGGGGVDAAAEGALTGPSRGVIGRVGEALGDVGGAVVGAGKAAISKVGDFIKDDPLKAAQLGLAGLGTIQGAQQQGEADKLRRTALAGLNEPGRENLDELFGDPHDPYRQGTGPNRAKRAALASLGSY